MNFKEYLQAENHTSSTIKEHLANLRRFEAWCKLENYTDNIHLSYRELTGYVQHLRSKNLKAQTINIYLGTLTKYYSFLIAQEIRQDNPAKQLRVKKDTRKMHPDLLKEEELDQLYNNYKNRETFREEKHRLIHQRHTALLSLIIYQALDSTALQRVETHHLDFDKGTIYIPETMQSNERTLKLHPAQILLLYQYITQTMKALNVNGSILFPGIMGNTLFSMLKYIKQVNPSIRNVGQLRTSVLVQWVRKNNIRQVQYMAGHRHISSTEHYKQQDIESLEEAVLKYHPLG